MTTQQVIWDLSELFPSITDPKINQAMQEIKVLAKTFEMKYRGKIADLNPKGLLQCIINLETFKEKFNNITLFSTLSFSANMTLPQTQSLHDRVNKLKAAIRKQLAFYQLELANLLKNNPQIIWEPTLHNYKHMLERIYRDVKHQLSEVEEQLIIEKDQFGVDAWKELQSKWLNTRVFDITVLGKKKTLSYGEANGLLSHPERTTRESANKSIYGLLDKDGEIFASALRNICNDWVNVCNRRKHSCQV